MTSDPGRATPYRAAIDDAVAEHQPSHVFALFSGGHDSLCSTYVAAQHPSFSGVCHVNTGIGIEETREFVRETCREHGWPLLEYHPQRYSYEDLVRQKGMPRGRQSHHRMFFYLKQQSIERLVREHKTSRSDRIGLVTGVRKAESDRRFTSTISVPVRRKGAQLWINPILDWTKADCNAYIAEHGLRRNEVSDTLHRSGECLCGALANHREITEIERWYPKAAAEIHRLEQIAAECGHRSIKWAYAPPEAAKGQMMFDEPLCASCQGGYA